MLLKCCPALAEKNSEMILSWTKTSKKALMKGRQSFHFFNPKLIIPTPVLHAQGKDGSLLPWEVSTLPSVPLLPSLCPFLTQMTWNWVGWTNAPPVTRHRQGVQPNWTDLSDWGYGVKPTLSHYLISYWGKAKRSHHPKEKVKTSLEILWVEFEKGDGHGKEREN